MGQPNNYLLRLARLGLFLLRGSQLLGFGPFRVLLSTLKKKKISLVRLFISGRATCLHDKDQDQQTGDNRVPSTKQPKVLVESELGIYLCGVNHSPQSGDSDGQVNRDGKHKHSCSNVQNP